MTISPLLERFVSLGDRTGIVMAVAWRDFQTTSERVSENVYVPRISPGDGSWQLLVLIDGKLENWPAAAVEVK